MNALVAVWFLGFLFGLGAGWMWRTGEALRWQECYNPDHEGNDLGDVPNDSKSNEGSDK